MCWGLSGVLWAVGSTLERGSVGQGVMGSRVTVGQRISERRVAFGASRWGVCATRRNGVLYSKFSVTCVIRRELRLGLGLVYTPRDAP